MKLGNEEGSIALGEHSPKMIASKLKEAMQVVHEKAAAVSLGADNFGGRICTDVPRALCRSRKTDAWSRYLIKSANVGGLWTRDRSAAAGHKTSTSCPLCLVCQDSLRHRVWQCQHPQAVQARKLHSPQWFTEIACAPGNSADTSWVNGLMRHPCDKSHLVHDRWPSPCKDGFLTVRNAAGEIIPLASLALQ